MSKAYLQEGPINNLRPALSSNQLEIWDGSNWSAVSTKDILSTANGTISVNSQRLINGAYPQSSNDLATKEYVDGQTYTITTAALSTATMLCKNLSTFADGDYHIHYHVTGRASSSHYGAIIYFMVSVTSGVPTILNNSGDLISGQNMANGAVFDISVSGTTINLLITPASTVSTVWKNKVIVR